MKDQKNKICLLVNVSIPCDHNIFAKQFNKLRIYKHLLIEIEKLYNRKLVTLLRIERVLEMSILFFFFSYLDIKQWK